MSPGSHVYFSGHAESIEEAFVVVQVGMTLTLARMVAEEITFEKLMGFNGGYIRGSKREKRLQR